MEKIHFLAKQKRINLRTGDRAPSDIGGSDFFIADERYKLAVYIHPNRLIKQNLMLKIFTENLGKDIHGKVGSLRGELLLSKY